MEITQEQFEAFYDDATARGVLSRISEGRLKKALASIGVAVAPPKPAEAMVNLAREIAEKAGHAHGELLSPLHCALAALQYAEKVVRSVQRYTDSKSGDQYAYLPRILTAIGSNHND